MYLRVMIVFLFVLGSVPTIRSADQVKLKNGDLLKGRVSSVKDGLVTLETSYSDPIKIDISKVVSLTTEQPLRLELDGGDVVTGKVVGIDGGKLVLSTTHSGQISILTSKVKGFVQAPSKVVQTSTKELTSLKTPLNWNGSVTLGGSYQTGNNENAGLDIEVTGERKTDVDRFSTKLQYHYAETDQELTTRNTYGAIKYDYLFWDRTYWYLSTELEADEFRDLALQTIAGGGLGYKLFDKENFKLEVEGGLAYQSDNYKEAPDESKVTGRLSAKLEWKFMEKFLFKDHFIIYPSVENMGEYQYRNEAALVRDLGNNWALKLTNTIRYNSEPALNVEEMDIYWGFGLRYQF